MVQLTRIYTGGGDNGKTSLGNGTRVQKSNLRICAIGDVDELNCQLGIVDVKCQDAVLKKLIYRIQNELFDLGADLCIPDDTSEKLKITDAQHKYLETKIDQYNADLPPLKSFILPGGCELGAYMHAARAITRRAERTVCGLNEFEYVNCHIITYLNRLSDLLFVLARFVNINTGEEVLWIPGKSR